jgi:hypothetical protein
MRPPPCRTPAPRRAQEHRFSFSRFLLFAREDNVRTETGKAKNCDVPGCPSLTDRGISSGDYRDWDLFKGRIHRRMVSMAETQVSIRVDLETGGRIGPGKIALLEAIRKTGSITAAAQSMQMSYREHGYWWTN